MTRGFNKPAFPEKYAEKWKFCTEVEGEVVCLLYTVMSSEKSFSQHIKKNAKASCHKLNEIIYVLEPTWACSSQCRDIGRSSLYTVYDIMIGSTMETCTCSRCLFFQNNRIFSTIFPSLILLGHQNFAHYSTPHGFSSEKWCRAAGTCHHCCQVLRWKWKIEATKTFGHSARTFAKAYMCCTMPLTVPLIIHFLVA